MDSNSGEFPEEKRNSEKGGAQSGARGDDASFAEAILAVQRLPLSDEEKAAILRRLMRGQ